MISKARKRFLNVTILTSTSLSIRFIALSLQIWLVGQIGSAGIGLFQLIMSVNALASTLAISGISYGTTRLIAEEIGMGKVGGIRHIVRRCTAYALLFSIASAFILLLSSERIGLFWLADVRTVIPIRLLAISLPFISLSAVLQGYFTAIGRVYKAAIVHLAEQSARVLIIMVIMKLVSENNIEKSCIAIVAGGTASEILSFILMSTLYIFDIRRHGGGDGSPKNLTSRIIGAAMPIAIISYIKTSLSMLQHLLVPSGLRAAGFATEAALSGYGIIQGMVFPLVYFPSCLLFATSELIVPDMTEAQVAGNNKYISSTSTSLLNRCLIFAVCTAGALYTYADSLSLLLYGSNESAIYIRVFSLVVPILYSNIMIDGLLKGLGQQSYSMVYTIIVAVLSILLIRVFLPLYALSAYILIICVTECITFACGFIRLNRLAQIQLSLKRIILSVICSVGAFKLSHLLTHPIDNQSFYSLVIPLTLGCLLYVGAITFVKKIKMLTSGI